MTKTFKLLPQLYGDDFLPRTQASDCFMDLIKNDTIYSHSKTLPIKNYTKKVNKILSKYEFEVSNCVKKLIKIKLQIKKLLSNMNYVVLKQLLEAGNLIISLI